MKFSEGCWRRRLAVLVIGANLVSGCATVGSDGSGSGACPPVVEYSQEFQARVGDELALLPEGSAIAELLADYSVMRDQAHGCS